MTAEHRDPTEDLREIERWLRDQDGEVRVILAEFAEAAGRANVLWTRALNAVKEDPDWSWSRLADLEVLLESIVQVEIDDLLKVLNEASERFEAALPDDDTPAEAAGSPASPTP